MGCCQSAPRPPQSGASGRAGQNAGASAGGAASSTATTPAAVPANSTAPGSEGQPRADADEVQVPSVVQPHDHGVKRRLDLKRDTQDHRDLVFNVASHSKVRDVELPAAVDLRPAESFPLYSQGELGSCTANALCTAFHFIQLQEGVQDFAPSRLFVYFNERAIEGHVGEDTGASLRDGIRSLCMWGVCDEKLWPYDVSQFTVQPKKECYDAALANRCKQYARVEQNLASLKGCIAAGYPFVFGFMVLCDFMAGEVQNTGDMEWPPKGMPHGGHAVQACGYDDAKQCFIVRNSWGQEWGDNGYFYMPYRFMTHPQLCHDFWAIVLVDGAEFPTRPLAGSKPQGEAEGEAGGSARAPLGGA